MKGNQLLLLGLFGLVIYLVMRQPPAAGLMLEANPSGGKSGDTPQDVFGSVLGTINSIFSTVGVIAQSAPKTT